MRTQAPLNLLLAAVLLTLATAAAAGGDADAGKTKSAICASCHGLEGISPQPNFPILAGQYPDYIVRALKDYKSGERENAIMKGFVANLTEQDMWDIAAYFYSQEGLTAPRISNP